MRCELAGTDEQRSLTPVPSTPFKPGPPTLSGPVSPPAKVLPSKLSAVVAPAPSIDAPLTLTGGDGQPIAVIVEPKVAVPLAVQYAPYGTAGAAVIAATIAAAVALWGIRANRKNLLEQIEIQRLIAKEQLTVQRDMAAKQLNTQQELAVLQLETQRQLSARTSWASVVSANRQRWIDGLREDLAELIGADFVLLEDAKFIRAGANNEDLRVHDARVNLANDRRRMLYKRIQLRLNPEKSTHQELLQVVERLLNATDAEAHGRALEDLTSKSQSLLRREWLRVKAEASGESALLPSADPMNSVKQANAADNAAALDRFEGPGA